MDTSAVILGLLPAPDTHRWKGWKEICSQPGPAISQSLMFLQLRSSWRDRPLIKAIS